MKVRERHILGGLRVLGKVSYEIQGFQGPLDSFQGFLGPLDTLHLQDKLVSYFHSKSNPFTDLDTLTLDVSPTCFRYFQSSIKSRPLHLVSLLLDLKK